MARNVLFSSSGVMLLLMLLLSACLQGRAAMLRRSLRAKALHWSCGPLCPALVLSDTNDHGASRSLSQIGGELPGAAHPPAAPLQTLPIALHRPSTNNFLCLNFENEVRKTNYSGLSNQRTVLKESEETGSCCSPLLQSCVRKIGHWHYGQDTLRVPDGKCDFFPSPPFSTLKRLVSLHKISN